MTSLQRGCTGVTWEQDQAGTLSDRHLKLMSRHLACLYSYSLLKALYCLSSFYWSIVDYNIVLMSGIQQSDSDMYIYLSFIYWQRIHLPMQETQGLIPGWERSPGVGNGNLIQYFCLENSMGKRSLVGYSPWGHEESDTIEHTHK